MSDINAEAAAQHAAATPPCRCGSVAALLRRARCTSSLGLCLTLLLCGCRAPVPPVLKQPTIGLIYDTDYERQIKSGQQLPALLDGVWEPCFDTLAEPVAVRQWTDTSSSWQILFATNRGELADPGKGERLARGRQHYGNQVLSVPLYGSATVKLPHRERGEEPRRAPIRRRLTSLAGFRRRDQSTAPADAADPAAANPAAGESTATDSSDSGAAVAAARTIGADPFFAQLHDLLRRSRQRDVLLFVHGFNVDFDSSLIRTAQLGLDIPFNGALIAWSWPTQGGVLKYDDDEPVNAASVQPFTEFLQTLRQRLPPETQLKIVVHSMGNRIVLQALNQLPRPAAGEQRLVRTLCLCAPDVGVADFEASIPGVVAQCERVVLYANNSDGALILSKSLHQEQRTGDADTPVVADGVELVDCSAVDLSVLGHSYFSGNVSVLADLFAVLKEHKTPEQRPYLRREVTDNGREYWVFREHPQRIHWSWHFNRPEDAWRQQDQQAASLPITTDSH